MQRLIHVLATLWVVVLIAACSREAATTDVASRMAGHQAQPEQPAASQTATTAAGAVPAGSARVGTNAAVSERVREFTSEGDAAEADELKTPLIIDDSAGEAAEELHQTLDARMRHATPARLWAEWARIRAGGNAREMDMLTMAIGDRLRQRPDPDVIGQIGARLQDPMTDYAEASALVEALELAASAESLSVLLDYLSALGESVSADQLTTAEDDGANNLRARVMDAINQSVLVDTGDGPNWQLSPVLERALREFTPEQPADALGTVAMGIAALGAPSGVQALLDTAALPEASGGAMARIACKAIGGLERIDPIPVLHEALADPALAPATRASVLDGLVSIGAADASLEVVNYLASTPELSDAQLETLGTEMVQRDYPRESLKVLEDALQNGAIGDPRALQMLEGVLASAPADWRLDGEEADVDGSDTTTEPGRGIESAGKSARR
jgi:hypothetical protein